MLDSALSGSHSKPCHMSVGLPLEPADYSVFHACRYCLWLPILVAPALAAEQPREVLRTREQPLVFGGPWLGTIDGVQGLGCSERSAAAILSTAMPICSKTFNWIDDRSLSHLLMIIDRTLAPNWARNPELQK
jgi:hypothetical protein